MSVLPCCFSLRVRRVHVVQAPCRVLKRPLPGSSASSRFDSGILKEAERGVLNARPLTMTQKMPESDRRRRVSHCQFRVIYYKISYYKTNPGKQYRLPLGNLLQNKLYEKKALFVPAQLNLVGGFSASVLAHSCIMLFGSIDIPVPKNIRYKVNIRSFVI